MIYFSVAVKGRMNGCLFSRLATGPSFHLKITYGYIILSNQQHRDKLPKQVIQVISPLIAQAGLGDFIFGYVMR